jgi:N-methylhydantoinase B/oxoprolinase/acetone carboxylase alpha subunit
VIRVETSGGGGFGDPARRAAITVNNDALDSRTAGHQ